MNHSKVFKWLADDLSPYPFVPVVDDLYMMNKEKTGVIKVDHVNGVTGQVHIAVLPELWGKADKFVEEALLWGFTNTRYQKAITFIPVYNKLAIRLAEKCGMEKEGLITHSFLKGWKVYDQLIYGITKKEGLCRQQQQQQ